MNDQETMVYKFGPWTLDARERLLLKGNERIYLQRREFDTLLLFVSKKVSGHELLTKDDILEVLAPDAHVQESSVTSTVYELRKILGEKVGDRTYIETVSKKGYRFIQEVRKEPRLGVVSMSWRTVEPEDTASFFPTDANNDTEPNAYRPFLRWLKKNLQEFPLPSLPLTGRLERDISIGNTLIVDTAPTHHGYSEIQMKEVLFPFSEFESLMQPFASDWGRQLDENSRFAGTKAAPISLTVPGTDCATPYLRFAKIPYHLLRAFHMLLEKNPEIQQALVRRAFEWINGRRIPASLAVDGAVIMKGQDAEQPFANRDLLLAHRVYREDGDRPLCWSASFEEQFAPIESYYGGRLHSQDRLLTDTTIRGVKEEFISMRFAKRVDVSLQAVSIELENLNLQLIGIVQLPDTSFSEVKTLWTSPDTPDYGEHDVLAALPLDSETLRRALVSECPRELGPRIRISNPDLSDYLDHPWHPRSRERIACCLWMLEDGALPSPG